jgi:hypothetical protein
MPAQDCARKSSADSETDSYRIEKVSELLLLFFDSLILAFRLARLTSTWPQGQTKQHHQITPTRERKRRFIRRSIPVDA